jgi:hypothetical protein
MAMTAETVPTIEQFLSIDGYNGRRIYTSEYDRNYGNGAYVPQRLIDGRWKGYTTSKKLAYSVKPNSVKSRVRSTVAYKTVRGAYNFLLKKTGEN